MGSTFPQSVWRARRCLSSAASSRRLLTCASVLSIGALCWRPARRSCEVRRMGSSMASDELLEPELLEPELLEHGLLEHGLLEHGLLEHGLPEHALRVARTYSAAADHYALGSLSFWNRFGAGTVSRLPLQPGQSVRDLCCGAVASGIPAARPDRHGGHGLG